MRRVPADFPTEKSDRLNLNIFIPELCFLGALDIELCSTMDPDVIFLATVVLMGAVVDFLCEIHAAELAPG